MSKPLIGVCGEFAEVELEVTDRIETATYLVAGALTGALLGFGDVPLFLDYPFLNEKSLMIATSLLFVLARTAITRSPKRHNR